MNMTFNFNNPTNLIFGNGKLDELGGQIVARRKAGTLGKKALLLISNGKSTKTNGSFDRVMAQLKEASVEVAVFDKIMENPLKSVVMEGPLSLRKTDVISLWLLEAARCWILRLRFLQWQQILAICGTM